VRSDPGRRRSPYTAEEKDAVLALRLVDDLEFRAGIDTSTLDLVLRGGRARVSGTISDADEIHAIRDFFEEEQGISDVEIQVQLNPTRREEERDLARAVVECFEDDVGLAEEDLQVACAAGLLVLRGVVQVPSRKHLAGLLAMRVPGVDRLRNRIVVECG
jgi:hypothetical protein